MLFFLLFDIIKTGDIMNPFTFKNKRKNNYFEGYYLRLIDQKNGFNKAFIFGVTKYKEDKHAFIQIVDGDLNKMFYHRFDINDFSFKKDIVYIKDNYLSTDSMHLSIKDYELTVNFENTQGLPYKYFSNSAMGIMHLLKMKTYQEVVFMDGSFHAVLKDKIYEGKLYMEKTYGHHFPENWIWIQSNHFSKNVKLSCSIGEASILNIPFKGYIISVIHNDKEYRFTTYNSGKLQIKKSYNNIVEIEATHKKYKIQITARLIRPIKLLGPSDNGNMNLDVYESLNSLVNVKLYHKNKILFETLGSYTGMENMYEN